MCLRRPDKGFHFYCYVFPHSLTSYRHCVQNDLLTGRRSSIRLDSNVRSRVVSRILPQHMHNFLGCELTGDTVSFGKDAWGDAWNARIMSVPWVVSTSLTWLNFPPLQRHYGMYQVDMFFAC